MGWSGRDPGRSWSSLAAQVLNPCLAEFAKNTRFQLAQITSVEFSSAGNSGGGAPVLSPESEVQPDLSRRLEN